MRLLTVNDVLERCRISKATLYRRMRQNAFPQPVKVGPQGSRWREDEIDAWIAELSAERDGSKTGTDDG